MFKDILTLIHKTSGSTQPSLQLKEAHQKQPKPSPKIKYLTEISEYLQMKPKSDPLLKWTSVENHAQFD